MKRTEQKQFFQSKKINDKENPQMLINLIPSSSIYPFVIHKIVNLVELSYTCLVDKKIGQELLGMEVVGGYRMLRIPIQDESEEGEECMKVQSQGHENLYNKNFVIVFILLIDDLSNIIREHYNATLTLNQVDQHEIPSLYVPFSIYQQIKKDININATQQPIMVNFHRFPIRYGPNLHVLSIDQEVEKIAITNLKLPSNDQVFANQIKQLITKIIIHPKYSTNIKNTAKHSTQQFEFLLFPQSKYSKVIIDLQWLDQNVFLKHLSKLSLKTKAKLMKMKKINQNANKNANINFHKNYLQFEITPIVKNKQDLKKSNKLFIAKFVPGKTIIEFEPVLGINSSVKPFVQSLQLSQIYHQVFNANLFFSQLIKRFLSEINLISNQHQIICLKSDKSIGIGALLNHITDNYLKDKKFVKINCQKFASLTEFFNKVKDISNDGNTLIYMKNLSWLETLSKNQEIVQDTMKSLIQKIYKTLQTSYQPSLCHFICVLYFSHTQIPQELPKGTKRIVSYLQKGEKAQIIDQIFYYLGVRLTFIQPMKETVTNMLINSIGWTRIYKFLLSLQKITQKETLNEKSLAAKIQKSFSLQNVENVTQVSWSDIGGLETAKEEIIQTVLLPTKHPQIFDEWIRPRTGLLFYGPPGTGKTLLGKCIAKECKMGFISVKGPQLLNMYVGESEKNVRQVFQRAKQSKPCIVFMDELDALVPKRGNSSDSNAVMDRIVAQLLMQIDMASQNQVFVIGATNRPDLLDPSILRAGRFDKQIYLGISKNKQDRIKILKAQTRNSKLEENFNYESIEQSVPLNFTGADFYGLTSKSMMRAVERSIDAYQKDQISDPQVIITTEDFLSIISSVKPSVSEEQLRHYECLKQRFSF